MMGLVSLRSYWLTEGRAILPRVCCIDARSLDHEQRLALALLWKPTV